MVYNFFLQKQQTEHRHKDGETLIYNTLLKYLFQDQTHGYTCIPWTDHSTHMLLFSGKRITSKYPWKSFNVEDDKTPVYPHFLQIITSIKTKISVKQFKKNVEEIVLCLPKIEIELNITITISSFFHEFTVSSSFCCILDKEPLASVISASKRRRQFYLFRRINYFILIYYLK